MKSFSITHIVFFLMLVYRSALAQDYAITIKGDTLKGKVRPLNYGPEKKVTIKDVNGKKTTLSLFQTKAYVIDHETFHPVKNEKGYMFMKLVKPGYLSLYAFQPENQTTYDGYYLLKKDGSGTEVPNLSFKKIITRFLADDTELSEKIEKGEFNKRQLNEIIDEYNEYINKRSVNQHASFAAQREKFKGLEGWRALEDKVKLKDNFKGKNDVLEMIGDVKTKINNSEKIPNFLIEGLRSALSETDLKDDLENTLGTY
jgi:hypothetical protein